MKRIAALMVVFGSVGACGPAQQRVDTLYLSETPRLVSVTRDGATLSFEWSASAMMWQGALQVRLVCDAGAMTVMPEWIDPSRMQITLPAMYAPGTCEATIEPLNSNVAMTASPRMPVHLRFDRATPYLW